jgi:hypothetical protein
LIVTLWRFVTLQTTVSGGLPELSAEWLAACIRSIAGSILAAPIHAGVKTQCFYGLLNQENLVRCRAVCGFAVFAVDA